MTDATYEPIVEEYGMPATKGDLKLLSVGIEEKLANIPTKADFSQLLKSVDGLAGQVKTYNDERSAEGARLKRIEDWIKKAAATINIPIEF